MVYTEWLRVRNILRGYAYVFLALFIVVVVLRVAFNSQMSTTHWEDEAKKSGATSTTQKLADGTIRTTIDDPGDNHTHIVIDDHGWSGKHVTVRTGRAQLGRPHSEHDHLAGFLTVSETDSATSSTIDVDTRSLTIDIGYLFMFSFLSAFVMATILGAPLARENGDHLEVVFTRPVSRLRLALNIVLADFVGILGSFAVTIAFALASISLFQLPHIGFSVQGFWLGLTVVLSSFAWYAMYLALTSMMKRGRGAVLGLAWPAGGLVIPLLAKLPLGDSSLGHFVHTTFSALAWLDPYMYAAPTMRVDPGQDPVTLVGLFGISVEAAAGLVAILTIVYLAVGLYEWQRVEA
jgi:hypothetical protein